jgi:hypothetical protein
MKMSETAAALKRARVGTPLRRRPQSKPGSCNSSASAKLPLTFPNVGQMARPSRCPFPINPKSKEVRTVRNRTKPNAFRFFKNWTVAPEALTAIAPMIVRFFSTCLSRLAPFSQLSTLDSQPKRNETFETETDISKAIFLRNPRTFLRPVSFYHAFASLRSLFPDNPYKIRTNSTIFANAHFLTTPPSATYNFSPLKCTDFYGHRSRPESWRAR